MGGFCLVAGARGPRPGPPPGRRGASAWEPGGAGPRRPPAALRTAVGPYHGPPTRRLLERAQLLFDGRPERRQVVGDDLPDALEVEVAALALVRHRTTASRRIRSAAAPSRPISLTSTSQPSASWRSRINALRSRTLRS